MGSLQLSMPNMLNEVIRVHILRQLWQTFVRPCAQIGNNLLKCSLMCPWYF